MDERIRFGELQVDIRLPVSNINGARPQKSLSIHMHMKFIDSFPLSPFEIKVVVFMIDPRDACAGEL